MKCFVGQLKNDSSSRQASRKPPRMPLARRAQRATVGACATCEEAATTVMSLLSVMLVQFDTLPGAAAASDVADLVRNRLAVNVTTTRGSTGDAALSILSDFSAFLIADQQSLLCRSCF